MSMDIIYLRDLKVDAIIGIFEWERRVKQTLSLDLEMAADIRKAARSDAIEDTLDYKAVAKMVIHFVEHSDYQLVETLAEEVVRRVMTEFDIPWMRLQINKKGAIRGARDVGVIIERGVRAQAQ